MSGAFTCVTVTDILYNPLSPVNLISATQLGECTNARVHLNGVVGHAVIPTDEGDVLIQLEVSDGIYAFVTLDPELPTASA